MAPAPLYVFFLELLSIIFALPTFPVTLLINSRSVKTLSFATGEVTLFWGPLMLHIASIAFSMRKKIIMYISECYCNKN